MPAAVLASRVRSGPAETSPAHRPPSYDASPQASTASTQWNVSATDATTRQGPYEPRGRHQQNVDATPAADLEHATVKVSASTIPGLPPQTALSTDTMKKLGSLPIRRAWRAKEDKVSPDMSQGPVLEAIMLHERGELQGSEQQCSRCKRARGISPECVKMPGIHNGACSNCLIERTLARPGSTARPTRSYSAERRSISAIISPSIPKEDVIAVWNLIAGVISAQPQECFIEDDTEMPGKRIEDAARLVARSADEWGHIVNEQNPDLEGIDDGPSEKGRRVRQAARIRETALQIADCARDWGEKLEKKRSSSRLRTQHMSRE
ncbi:hypothetical protein CCHL11_06213 [Colletotrichum chlorophyti]|uniref:Uncharacterized protein n=1 Tax=Colletotrichum chlorophyti TaxID=708187 RepID=A0A1Q8RT41_9PEZI|nr:hypothetical protein CCHL11_06213 [Colletotrichum chlorophyti]